MKYFKYVVGLVLAVALAACGGGGGNPGTSSGGAGVPQPLVVAAPSVVTVAPGAAAVYAISGGQTPYSAVSDNTSITQVAVDQANNLTVGGVLEGTALVQVRDAKAALVALTVNVSAGPSRALYTTAPNSLSMAPTTAQSFSIGGGKAPYVVFSDKVSVATATASGSVLSINAIAVGAANLKISDSLGATTNVAVNVASSSVALSLSPTTASVYVNMAVEVSIIGGTPPYRLGGSIPAAVLASVAGNKLTITPLLVSSGLDISVLDSQNETVKFTLNVIDGQPTIRLSPNALSVSEINTVPIVLTAFGATGTVAAFSSDLSLFSTRVSIDNQLITVTQMSKCVATDTPVTITVVDANRALATAIITVKDNGNISAAVAAVPAGPGGVPAGTPAVPANYCPPN